MQTFDNGAFYSVTVTCREIEAFAARWPCSGMQSPKRAITFQFDKRNGDLVASTGTFESYDQGAVTALLQDAREYGAKKLAARKFRVHLGGTRYRYFPSVEAATPFVNRAFLRRGVVLSIEANPGAK